MLRILSVFVILLLLFTACDDEKNEEATDADIISVKDSDSVVVDEDFAVNDNETEDEDSAVTDIDDADISIDEDNMDEDITVPDTDMEVSDEIVDDDFILIDEDADVISEMILIPAGAFSMGCNSSVDSNCLDDEKPYHTVTLADFYIDKYEVTSEDYEKCITAGACNNNIEEEHNYLDYTNSSCFVGNGVDGEIAANCISWFGAYNYCAWIGKRLPTEAEWEKAARGTDGRLYPWGEDAPDCTFTVMYDNSQSVTGCGNERPWAPGLKVKDVSPYGVYDMAGNVTEWVNDRYSATYYSSDDAGVNPSGPLEGNNRVFRGGFWGAGDSKYFRTSSRMPIAPAVALSMNGFRCARDAE